MRRCWALLTAALLLACLTASQASAAQLSLTQAGSASFPEREFLLTLGTRGVVTTNQVSVREGGVPVHGLSVEPASALGASHFGTVLLVDTSDSMSGLAEADAIKAARTYVATRNPKEPVGIIFFDQTPRVVVPMSTDNAKLDAALANVPPLHSGTHIYDAVQSALHMLAAANLTGGSIVIASDGRDTGSTVNLQSVASHAAAQGARFYTVGVIDPSFDGTSLQKLAAATGGVYTPVASGALSSLYHNLGLSLFNEYLIRYESRSPLGVKVPVTVSVAGHGTVHTTYETAPVPAAAPSNANGGGSGSYWQSTTAAIIVSLMSAILLGVALLALISRTSGVRQRVGPFVGASEHPIEDRPRSLVQRALGDSRHRRVQKSQWSTVLAEDVDVARIQVTPPRLIGLTLLATVLLCYVLFIFKGPLAAVLGLLLPFAVRYGVKVMATRQRREFNEQLPDNLAVVASALRAGNTFVGSLGVVTQDAPEPSKREIRRALADEQLGVPLVDALNRISERMQSTDFQHVALVATLQQETGGNTAEILDVVTETIRERLELRRMVRSLTAQGRLAGGILSGLPVALLLGISLINPQYVAPLFHNIVGIIALAVAAIMVASGSIIIRRIVNIDV